MSTTAQNKSLTVFDNAAGLGKYLEQHKAQIGNALPKHLNVDRMLRIALTCFSTTPKLRECTAQSILGSLVIAGQLGLEPGVTGQGYLIPYYDNRKQVSICTFIPGWQGLVSLLNNTGRATAWTGAVFEGDEWIVQFGSDPKCVHIPGENFGDPTKLIWAYACGKVNGSEMPVVEAWPMKRIFKHRDRFNKVGNRHYSFEHPEMYARKVMLLQVLKYLPRSITLQNAMQMAEAGEAGRFMKIENDIVIDLEDAPEGNGDSGKRGAQDFTPSGATSESLAPGDQKPATPAEAVRRFLKANGTDEEALLRFLRQSDSGDYSKLEEMSEEQIAGLNASWTQILPLVKG